MALSAGSAIEALVKNPETFLKTNRLGCYLKGAVAKKDLVKLVPAKEKQSYDVQLSDKKGEKDTISAYILGYKASEVNDPLFLDIPTTGVPEGTFFFTAELSGCSVVVTRLKTDTYRVYHDYRVNSAVLYDNVVMSVDWEDYKIPKQLSEHGRLDPAKGRAVGHAVACMQFRDGAWKLFLQRHLQGITKQPNSPNWVLEVQVSVKQSVKKSDGVISEIVKDSVLETTFESRRSVLKKSVKALATSLKIDAAVIAKAEDGKYGGSGKFDANDPSIRGWNELRNAIQKELEKQDKAAKGTNPTNSIVGKHKDMLEAAEQFDKIWLWLQIKKAAHKK